MAIVPENWQGPGIFFMESRLELLDPLLIVKIKGIVPSKRRAYTIKIVQYVLKQSGFKHELVNKIEHDLVNGNFVQASRQKGSLESLLEELEEIQFHQRKEVNQGQLSFQDYIEAFNHARAVNALFYALDADSFIALTEATYEAYTITQDLNAIKNILT